MQLNVFPPKPFNKITIDITRAGIDSATVDSTADRELFPDCRQACFTVDSDNKIKKTL